MLQLILTGLVIVVGIDLANHEEQVGVDLVHLAHLIYIAVAKTQSDAETGQQLQQPTVVSQQLGKFGVFREWLFLSGHDVHCF